MSKFDNDKYKELINTFILASKRVLKKEISRNKNEHIEYATVLTESYNELVKYISAFYDRFDKQTLKNA